jgi:DNA repair protein RadC
VGIASAKSLRHKRFPPFRNPQLFRFLLAFRSLSSRWCTIIKIKIMETTIKNRQFEVAEIQLSYKTKVKPSQRPKISSSKDAYSILLESWDEDKLEFVEQFKVLLLNRANRVLGIYEVSTGGVSGTVADPKLVFAAAIKSSASAIIISHNHPSGQLNPSDADLKLTQKLKEGGKFLEIPVLDHIIVTSEGYYAFADEGVL